MFPPTYFPNTYYAPEYWAPFGAELQAPTTPGSEWTFTTNRLHYTAEDCLLDFTMPESRLHFTLTDEE